MGEDERFPDENTDENGELPASVIFMEIMRQAAAKSTPEKPESPPTEPVEDQPEAAAPETDETPAAVAEPEPAIEPLPERPLTEEERRQHAAMEAQRVRRVKRRQEKRRVRRASVLGGIIRSFLVIIPSALLMATILSWWTDPQFLRPEVRSNLQAMIAADARQQFVVTPTAIPTPRWLKQIGIVSGHNGPGRDPGILYDPGAVCPDGLEERGINLSVASLVVVGLRERGYSVDLLDEFDPRLNIYQAGALISIHANTCQDFGEYVSGFLVAKADARPEGGIDTQLAECVARHYALRSGLDRRFGLTVDMTDYHTFREIHPTTPAAIIELGFMLADREILTERPDLLSQGIIDGVLCFLEPEFESDVTPVASPTIDVPGL